MVNRNIRRKEYTRQFLLESFAGTDPHRLFRRWFKEAMHCGMEEPNAVTLATATLKGVPSARIVLLKGHSPRGFIFYTNYESAKGRDLARNSNAAMLFYWEKLERQVRIRGRVSKLNAADSDRYFKSRPRGAQIAASISKQSNPILNRESLERDWRAASSSKTALKRPSNWGGYILKPEEFEFWQGRENRLHDRLLFRKRGAGWRITRLAP